MHSQNVAATHFNEDHDMEIYRDTLKANMYKERGNHHFKIGDYDEAINCYTTALEADLGNAALYGNRAMALLKNAEKHRGINFSKNDPLPEVALKNYKAADQDCTRALQLDKDFVKAYYRRGQARKALGMIEEAIFDFESVLRLEPSNTVAGKELQSLKTELLIRGKPQKRFFTEYKSIPVEPLDSSNWIGCLKRIRIDEKNAPEQKPIPEEPVEKMQLDFVVKLPQPAKTSYQFYADWRHLEKCADKRLEYIFAVGASGIKDIFKDSMEVDVLTDIISILHEAIKSDYSRKKEIHALMEALTSVGRFDTLNMFLEEEETRKIREIISTDESLMKLWKLT